MLSKPVPISFWGINGMIGFRDQEPVIFTVKMNLINHSTGNNKVIPIFEPQFPQHGFQDTCAFMDKQQFIGIRIFIKIFHHGLFGCCQWDMNIGIEQHYTSTFQIIVHGLYFKTLEQPGLYIMGYHSLWGNIKRLPYFLYHSRSMQVVHKRRHSVKTYGPEQLLVMEASVLFLKNSMSFGGYFT